MHREVVCPIEAAHKRIEEISTPAVTQKSASNLFYLSTARIKMKKKKMKAAANCKNQID